MKLGVALGRLNPAFWLDVTIAAERLGYESVWLPEHLVFPVRMDGSPGDHPPPSPATPVFDAFAYLSYLAGKTTTIRLATHVYNLALRHPFVAARAVQTLDVVSNGRAIAGVGAGWLEAEWVAAGLDFATRGRRLDETLEVCVRLWTEHEVEHHGEFFDFAPVMFEPKPVQKPHPPVVVGGMSDAALRRAARYQGWVAMSGDLDVVAGATRRLRELRGDAAPVEITCGFTPADRGHLSRARDAGVDRVVVAPWRRSPDAIDALERLAGALA